MDSSQVFTFGQQGLMMLLTVSAPMLLVILVVGVLVSIFQAATQINEATLSFVPKLVAAVAVIAVAVLLWKVIPVFETMFASVNLELPAPTKFVIAMSRFVNGYWWAVIAGAVLMALLIGASRVVLSVHYLTDVLGGYLVGGAWLLAALAALPPARERNQTVPGASGP